MTTLWMPLELLPNCAAFVTPTHKHHRILNGHGRKSPEGQQRQQRQSQWKGVIIANNKLNLDSLSTTRICGNNNPSSSSSSSSSSVSNKNQLYLYNSLTRTKDAFHPQNPPSVSMYTCGPTVYDAAHVGNFRAFLTYDVLKRVLSYLGYTVRHVCNLTDVDDKIIKRCRMEDTSLREVTSRYERLFLQDLKALNIIEADVYPRATEHIMDMVNLVLELQNKGLAYQATTTTTTTTAAADPNNNDPNAEDSNSGSWYFNVAAKEGYGTQLVDLDVSNMQLGASNAGRVRMSNTEPDSIHNNSNDDMEADEYDAEKVGVRDFALWKAYKPDFDREDAVWDTPLGKGRPGWHLECSAMARRYLGDTIDLHCGGIDLKFPHHENEIAQSEGATGKRFCNCWVHNGFVNIGDEKMSKSKGNFLTLRDACPKSDDVRAYRYLVVSSHYRNPLSFTEAAMTAAKSALKRMDKLRKELDEVLSLLSADGDGGGGGGGGEIEDDMNVDGANDGNSDIATVVKKELTNFESALTDDLSMPRAAASLFGVVKAAENEFKRVKKAVKKKGDDETNTPSSTLDLVGLRAARDALEQMDQVFGIFYEVPKPEGEKGGDEEEESVDGIIPDEVMELVTRRSAAKEAKDWHLADSLRARIQELGFAVKDVKGGEPLVSRLE